MHLLIFKFRPSSHSEDYTISATYKTKRESLNAHKKLECLLEDIRKNPSRYNVDWNPDDASFRLNGKTVLFGVYSNGDIRDIEDILSDAEEYEVHTNYQEVTVKVKVPKGSSFEAALLILDGEEAEALKELKEVSQGTKVEEDAENRFFIFEYRGDGIFDDCQNLLLVGKVAFDLSQRDNWGVCEG